MRKLHIAIIFSPIEKLLVGRYVNHKVVIFLVLPPFLFDWVLWLFQLAIILRLKWSSLEWKSLSCDLAVARLSKSYLYLRSSLYVCFYIVTRARISCYRLARKKIAYLISVQRLTKFRCVSTVLRLLILNGVQLRFSISLPIVLPIKYFSLHLRNSFLWFTE